MDNESRPIDCNTKMIEDDELICFKWNNHRTTFFQVLSSLRFKEIYTDVTIACEGKFIAAHKLVLATCSGYFSEVFEKINCLSPVVILKDIKIRELEALINFIYHGEVDVEAEDVAGVIKAAECLQIKGLGVPDDLPMSVLKSSSLKKERVDRDSTLNENKSVKRKRVKQNIKMPIKIPKIMSNGSDTSTKHTPSVRKITIPILMKNAMNEAKKLNAQSKVMNKEAPSENETLGLAEMIKADISLTPVKDNKEGVDEDSFNSSLTEPEKSNISIEMTNIADTSDVVTELNASLEDTNIHMPEVHQKHLENGVEEEPMINPPSRDSSILNENSAENIRKTIENAQKSYDEHAEIVRNLTINRSRKTRSRNQAGASTSRSHQEAQVQESIIAAADVTLPTFSVKCNAYLYGNLKDTNFLKSKNAVLSELFEHHKHETLLWRGSKEKRQFFDGLEKALLNDYPTICIEEQPEGSRKYRRTSLGPLIGRFCDRVYRYKSRLRVANNPMLPDQQQMSDEQPMPGQEPLSDQQSMSGQEPMPDQESLSDQQPMPDQQSSF